MAKYYSWAQAWNTKTETVELNMPLATGTSEADASSTTALTFIAADKYTGRLIAVDRGTKVARYVHIAGGQAIGDKQTTDTTPKDIPVDFAKEDLYMVAENLYAGNDFFVGYVIDKEADLGHLEERTFHDDLMAQYVATKTNWPGRQN